MEPELVVPIQTVAPQGVHRLGIAGKDLIVGKAEEHLIPRRGVQIQDDLLLAVERPALEDDLGGHAPTVKTALAPPCDTGDYLRR